jgi:hypothetical protein
MKKLIHPDLKSTSHYHFTYNGSKQRHFLIAIIIIMALFFSITTGCRGKKRSAAQQHLPIDLPWFTIKDSGNYDCQSITKIEKGDTLALILPEGQILNAIVTRSYVNINNTHNISATIVDHPSGNLSLSTTHCVSMGTIVITELSVTYQIITDQKKSVIRLQPTDDSQNLQRDDVLIPPHD